jgi:hypothetical protein
MALGMKFSIVFSKPSGVVSTHDIYLPDLLWEVARGGMAGRKRQGRRCPE